MKDFQATVAGNKEIAQNIYKIDLDLPKGVEEIHGGQFANISTGEGSQLLRRPLGVCTAEGNQISLCYQLKGEGTKKLATAKAGDKLNVLLPLGNYFNLEKYKNVAVIGGGVGIFPLIATIRENCKSKNLYSYIGFRNKQAVCLLEELKKSTALTVVTDDGSYGKKGNAVQAFFEDEKKDFDAIIACGPPAMLRALKIQLEENNIQIPCFVSLEERMGCGIGACLVCVCRTSNGSNARVCKDGPVFDIKEVNL